MGLVTPWGFDSPRPHHPAKEGNSVIVKGLVERVFDGIANPALSVDIALEDRGIAESLSVCVTRAACANADGRPCPGDPVIYGNGGLTIGLRNGRFLVVGMNGITNVTPATPPKDPTHAPADQPARMITL